MHRRTIALLAAATLLAAPVLPADAAAPDHARRQPTVTITGTGYGHGRGLSQYGARNRADAGQSYRKIVEHYYPRTHWARSSGNIRVLLTADTTGDVVVVARDGLKVRSLGAHHTWTLPARHHGTRVKRWRIDPAPGHRSSISYKTRSWHAWRTPKGDAEFSAGGKPLTLVLPHGTATYRGSLRSASADADGTPRDTVDVLGLDTYLRGVVPDEVPASWSPAAVRAQAVAARTYAAYERAHAPAGRSYDLCDTDHCQVYGGYDDEQPASDAAVARTAGRIVSYDGGPAFAQFSSSNGGWSVDGGFPYLRAAADPYDHGYPGDPWTATFTDDQVARNWPGLGTLQSVQVTERDGNGAYGGRATEVTVTGSTSSVTVAGDTFASYLGLRSTLFRITGQ